MEARLTPGDQAVVRNIFGSQLWHAMPCLVVEDSDDLTVLWIPPETR